MRKKNYHQRNESGPSTIIKNVHETGSFLFCKQQVFLLFGFRARSSTKFKTFNTLLQILSALSHSASRFFWCVLCAPVQFSSAFGFHLLSPPSKTKWRTTSNLLYYIWILFCYTFPTMYCYVFHPCHAYTLYNLCSTTYT